MAALPNLKAPTDLSSLCHLLDGCTTPPPPPSPPSSDSTTIRFQHTSLVPALPVAAASLVVAAFLALLIGFFIVHLRRRRRRRPAAVPAPDDPGAGADAVVDGGDDEEAVHHVWYIRTVGLDESVIHSITAWAYKAGKGVLGDSATDCTVCLSEFRDGELVRLLPWCSHAFHLICIDKWLRSHVNCPLCRAPVVAPNTAISSGDPGTSTAFSSSSSSSSAASSLPLPESGLDPADPNSISSSPAYSNQTDGQRLEAVGGTVEVQMECERLDLGSRNRTVVGPSQIPDLLVSNDIGEDGFQLRRSVSMDSFISVLKLDADLSVIPNRKNPAWEEEWKGRTRAKHSSISSFRKEVGRSLVSASGRFFLSVQGRARSSVLPL